MKSLLLGLFVGMVGQVQAQPTVRFDATKTHQHITGFGGFVCSPQFTYNHMSTTEIKKVWGKSSTVGCNIMRLYIPIGRNAWGQSLATAKTAKEMGLIVFASPWGQPVEWKTNGTINAKDSDGTLGYLKKENWPDYAQYLEDYVKYLRQNGVELDAISIQNEPDWQASYAGCLWSASEIAEFVKTYGAGISCKVMAPETLSVNDNYVNALNKTDVLNGFDIYGGHQYGGIQSAYKNLAKKGKEIWMTEYLINWNEGKADADKRNYDFSKDFFDFFRAINTCMLGDFNAWIHYAAKRYYGMMGDGTTGAGSSGTITKRGYIMAHFAKYVTGSTRIDIDFGTTGLEGSAYLSVTGDSVMAVMANTSDAAVAMTLDLPFYTQGGKLWSTTKTKNMGLTTQTPESETCRPVITVPALSVSTVLFVRSRDRQPSDMKGKTTRFDRLDDMIATKTGFGTNYKLSGKTKTFDSSNPLISSRTNATYGYVALDDRYSQLVMHINKVTTTSQMTAGATTLTYVNSQNEVVKHDYGRMDLGRGSNFDLVFDLSPTTLADGCIGLISLTCDNAVSKLTITFGDVYLSTNTSSNYAATLSGNFVEDDSYVQEYIGDAACTSIDLSACSGIPATFPWLQGSNRVVWLPENSSVDGANLIQTSLCHLLELSADGGDFRPHKVFTANEASLTVAVDGCRLVMVPFNAAVPEGVKAYTVNADLTLEQMRSIPAHTPVLVEGQGLLTFKGSGEVSFARSPLTDWLRGTYASVPLCAGDYVLAQQNGQWGFSRIEATTMLRPFDVYVTLDSSDAFVPLQSEGTGIESEEAPSDSPRGERSEEGAIFDLQGRKVSKPTRGLYIKNGKKYLK